MSDRPSTSTDEPRWGPASTHRVSAGRSRASAGSSPVSSPRSRPTRPSAGPAAARPEAPATPPPTRVTPTARRSGTWPGGAQSAPDQATSIQSTNPQARKQQARRPSSSQGGVRSSTPAPWDAASDQGVASGPSSDLHNTGSRRLRLPGRGGIAGSGGRRRRLATRLLIPLLILALLVIYPLTLARTAMGSMERVSALPQNSLGGGAAGRNFLVIGSDSRAGTRLDSVQGARADTIMLLHVPLRGKSVLVSIPRDSYVEIPGHSRNKINAAFALGGPQLLVQTVEQLSGIHIDDYVQTNLGGFSKVVDSVGGVRLCPKFDMNDKDAHINLKKGCQEMNGATALGYARARHSDPEGDLGRVKRQREVLSAIVKKAANPGTLLNPFNAYPLARAGGQALTVDESTSQWAIYRFLMGMRSVSGSKGLSVTVPVSDTSYRTRNGLAVRLDRERAPELFRAIRDGDTDKVPALTAK